MAILVFTWYQIGRLTYCGVKHMQFSSFIRVEMTIRLTVFYILCYIDLFIGFYYTPHYYFTRSSTIQRYKLISHPCNTSGIIISIILLLYLASCFVILRCIRDPVCHKLRIWYKGRIKNGLIKIDTYNIWWK